MDHTYAVQVWTAPSTRGCFKNSVMQAGDTKSYVLDAARNELVSFQILLKKFPMMLLRDLKK